MGLVKYSIVLVLTLVINIRTLSEAIRFIWDDFATMYVWYGTLEWLSNFDAFATLSFSGRYEAIDTFHITSKRN